MVAWIVDEDQLRLQKQIPDTVAMIYNGQKLLLFKVTFLKCLPIISLSI